MKRLRPGKATSKQMLGPRPATTNQITPPKKHRGGSWTRTSKAFRKRHARCQVCRSRCSTQVHHATPLSQDSSQENLVSWDGLVACCDQCHELLDYIAQVRPRPAWLDEEVDDE